MILRKAKLCYDLRKFKLILSPSLCAYQTKFYSQYQLQSDNWEPIYKLPLIRWVAAFNKIKIYQYIITTLSVPLTFTLESSSHIPEGTALVFSSLGITGCITLTVCSLFTNNLIGIVYVNKMEEKIKLAYVDFWGTRKNVEFAIDEIIPEEAVSKLDLYRKIRTVDGNNPKCKLLHNFGNVLNREQFISIFQV